LLGKTESEPSEVDSSDEEKETIEKIKTLVEKGKAEFAIDLVCGNRIRKGNHRRARTSERNYSFSSPMDSGSEKVVP
jgi:hypothetical protein